MSRAGDLRDWQQNTTAGLLHQELGIRDEVDYDAAEQLVEQTRQTWRRSYGRELRADELRTLREQAERRSMIGSGLPMPTRTADLQAVFDRMRARRDAAIAPTMVRGADGSLSYHGDVKGLAESEAIAAARVAAIAAGRDTIYPGSNGVAGPS